MIKIVEGDILSRKNVCPIICQQVNHKGVMGAGLAKKIKEKYPHIERGYKSMCKVPWNAIRSLGIVYWYQTQDFKIANIFGQENYGRDKKVVYTDYTSFKNGFNSVCLVASMEQMSVSVPYGIGCGLANGDWDIVYNIIKEVSEKHNVNIEIYKLSE